MEKHLMNTHEYSIMYKSEENHWWYKGLRHLLVRWIKILKPKRILDAGCGTGMNAFAVLKEEDSYLQGIDLSSEAVKLAKLRGLNNIFLGDITKLEFADKEFDVIYCMDVLSMLTTNQQATALKEFYRCLDVNGFLILNDTAFQFLYSAHDYSVGVKKRFTKKEVKLLLENEGFEVVFQTYRVFILFPFVALFKLIRRIELNTKKNRQEVIGDVQRTNKFINIVLYKIMQLENLLLNYFTLPFGTSVFTIAKKNEKTK